MTLSGLHHVSAITARIADNKRFYTETMGMRLVKRSVNQDDVSAYHLFYADAAGSPGTDLTFFDYAGARRETPGTRSITRTGLRVSGETSLQYWAQRLAAAGVVHTPTIERDGRLTLDFEDAEGQRLMIVDDGGLGDAPVVWDASPVPAEHQIRGLGPVVMSVPVLEQTDLMLRAVLNMRAVRTYDAPDGGTTHVYEMGEAGQGGAHAELHVAVQPDLPVVRPGAGGVHHVAFRTPDEAQYHAWSARLTEFGLPHSGEVDRYYFRSLYVREPGGILFEIATDGPGFAVDEDEATLGETVVLPPRLEPRRAEILAGLTPIG
ncbi:MAG TPA: ring-cleaving dioxygenase [Rubricoccaceae bacterium]|jgi:glyoxalase family protein